MVDLYEILGVSRNATDDEIKKAYRKKSFMYHPDQNPNDPNSEEMFKRIKSAYEVLSDPERRAVYDETGATEKVDFQGKMASYIVNIILPDLVGQMEGAFESVDMIQHVKNMLQADLNRNHEEKETGNRVVAKLNKFVERTKIKEGRKDFFINIVRNQIDQAKQDILRIDTEIEFLNNFLGIMDNYEYDDGSDLPQHLLKMQFRFKG